MSDAVYTILTEHAAEGGTYIIDVTFYDDDNAAVTPNSGLTWKLTDMKGNVINSRSAVSIASAPTVTVTLSGNDLVLGSSGRDPKRKLLVTGTYNSTAGSNLPIVKGCIFEIDDVV